MKNIEEHLRNSLNHNCFVERFHGNIKIGFDEVAWIPATLSVDSERDDLLNLLNGQLKEAEDSDKVEFSWHGMQENIVGICIDSRDKLSDSGSFNLLTQAIVTLFKNNLIDHEHATNIMKKGGRVYKQSEEQIKQGIDSIHFVRQPKTLVEQGVGAVIGFLGTKQIKSGDVQKLTTELQQKIQEEIEASSKGMKK